MLPHSQGVSRLPHVQSGMPALRGQAYSDAGEITYPSFAVFSAQNRCAARLDGARARRAADSIDGEGSAGHWPGMRLGVRGPTQDETPLSSDEVQFGFLRGVLPCA